MKKFGHAQCKRFYGMQLVMIVCTMIIEFQSLGQKDQVIFKFLKSQQL